jgi:hypothetical protein
VDDILHQRLARREQRRLSRLRAVDDARRLARVEVWVDAIQGQMTADSVVLGTSSVQQAPEPGVITRQARLSDEAACAALAELIWTPAERLALGALTAGTDTQERES